MKYEQTNASKFEAFSKLLSKYVAAATVHTFNSRITSLVLFTTTLMKLSVLKLSIY